MHTDSAGGGTPARQDVTSTFVTLMVSVVVVVRGGVRVTKLAVCCAVEKRSGGSVAVVAVVAVVKQASSKNVTGDGARLNIAMIQLKMPM